MPFIPNTPESRVARSDSKNAATTCRGITSGGRPCRRPLTESSSGTSGPTTPSRTKKHRVDDPSDPDLYCWQHKDQATTAAASRPSPAGARPQPGKSGRPGSRASLQSLESLMGRFGINDNEGSGSGRPSNAHGSKPANKPQAQKQVSFCCCFTIPVFEDDEENENEKPSTPKPRPVQTPPARPSSAKRPSHNNPHLAPPSPSQRPSPAASKKSSDQSGVSQTGEYLSLIPNTILPETAAMLLKELSKPFSPMDEAGYIYIFWLTPETQPLGAPTRDADDSLAPPAMHQRRTSDVLQAVAKQKKGSSSSSNTILLKIGRANNVQRRLNEWHRQCGYNLQLIRYYPYVSSSQQQTTVRKMPHSHKVERLIHIELEGQGLRVNPKANCKACGKHHKEWFEIEGTKAGINAVDAIVRRWSDWDEGNQ